MWSDTQWGCLVTSGSDLRDDGGSKRFFRRWASMAATDGAPRVVHNEGAGGRNWMAVDSEFCFLLCFQVGKCWQACLLLV